MTYHWQLSHTISVTGGWTLIKRIKVISKSADLSSVNSPDYRVISNYDSRKQVSSAGLLHLKADMGFDQIRLFCSKKSVGRVVDIITAQNTTGKFVVDYYTIDSIKVQPKACGSYEVLPQDTSELVKQCSQWGCNKNRVCGINRWGTFHSIGKSHRLYGFTVGLNKKHSFRMTGNFACDDQSGSPEPLSIGDIWAIYVR